MTCSLMVKRLPQELNAGPAVSACADEAPCRSSDVEKGNQWFLCKVNDSGSSSDAFNYL